MTSSPFPGRLVARDLAPCGIRPVLTRSATEAFTLAICMKPPLIIASATMVPSRASIRAPLFPRPARSGPILTGFSETRAGEAETYAGPPTIRTGDKLSDDLAEVITRAFGIG